MRSLCLRVLGTCFIKYPGLDYSSFYWTLFFEAVKPSIQKLGVESRSSAKPGALLACLVALSRSGHLAGRLGQDGDLMPSLLQVLGPTQVAPPVTSAVIGVVENLMALEEEGRGEIVEEVLVPHLGLLLERMQVMLKNRTTTDRDTKR